MNRLLSSALALIFGMTLLSSCTTNTEPTTNTATLLTIDQIRSNAGYAWFDAEKNIYKPDDSKVRDINEAFKNKNQKIYFFV
ncbi:MAG: hypothetical protein RJA11_854, partial [Bacteroidota bacterium]